MTLLLRSNKASYDNGVISKVGAWGKPCGRAGRELEGRHVIPWGGERDVGSKSRVQGWGGSSLTQTGNSYTVLTQLLLLLCVL